ncbi:hypothetical protein EG832_15625 [bacterium]|nr:hypothetical protein [bacterium]
MFAIAVNVQFQTGKIDEASRIVEESFVPALKEQKGFKAHLFLTQPDTGKAIALNLWESEEDQLAFAASPIYRELMGKLAGTIAATPVNAGYEVSVQA